MDRRFLGFFGNSVDGEEIGGVLFLGFFWEAKDSIFLGIFSWGGHGDDP